jgi:hypothetical protein
LVYVVGAYFGSPYIGDPKAGPIVLGLVAGSAALALIPGFWIAEQSVRKFFPNLPQSFFEFHSEVKRPGAERPQNKVRGQAG